MSRNLTAWLGWTTPAWLLVAGPFGDLPAAVVPGSNQPPAEVSRDPVGALPLVTTAGQVKRLARAEALRGYPVKIRGVITCIQPEFLGLVIQDSTLGVYVKFERPEDFRPPPVGELCEIEGVTDAGFAPMVRPRRVVRLGPGKLPEPVHPTWDQLLNGSLDTQYAELEGVITTLEGRSIVLLTRNGAIKVRIAGLETQTLQRAENALVRLRGCLFASHEDEKIALQVKVGEIELHNTTLTVEEPAPADLFAAPTKSIAQLMLFDPQAGPFQRVKVAGQIVYQRRGEFFLMDETNGLRFMPRRGPDLRVGDRVEVVGFPRLGGPSPWVREAVVRKLGQAPLPPPRELAPEQLLADGYDATLVRVDGVLVHQRNSRTEQALEIQSGVRAFLVRLEGGDQSWKSIPTGSRLELTGVYAAQGGDRTLGQPISGFELLANSAADIRVLARPPWWTLERLLAALGALGAVLALALVWIGLLRRQVEQRSAQLRQEIHQRERAEQQHLLEEERSRMARDLHDDLGSSLTEISMLAETGRDQLAGADDPRRRFDRILGRAQHLVRALDEIVWAVDPRKDTLPALVHYLAGFAEDYLAAAGMACRVETPPSVPNIPLAARVRHQLFLSVKETLHNAVRHGRGTEVTFQISLEDDTLALTVTDNGCGFDPIAPAKGNGLANLRQRCAGLEGHCEIASAPGAGARVRLSFPLTEPACSL